MNSIFNKLLQNLMKRETAQKAIKRVNMLKLKHSLNSLKNSPVEKHRRMFSLWKSWNDKQKTQAINNFKKDMGKNKTLFEYMTNLNRRVNLITTKLAMGKKLTTSQQQFLKDYSEFFVQEDNIWKPINSSWIISAHYKKSTKIMLVKMVRGKLTYPFYEVPVWVWVHLTTLPSNAGTWWWKEWIWKYSANNAKWK